MKKKWFIVLIVILIALVTFVILNFNILKSNISNGYDVNDKMVLVEKSYCNYAWGFTYNGSIICNDGSVYEFEFYEDNKLNKNNSLKETSNVILENVKKQKTRKVSEKDLSKILQYINVLEDELEHENTAVDAGLESIKVYNYDSDEIITIKEEGDYTGENKTKASQKLLKIVEKYL